MKNKVIVLLSSVVLLFSGYLIYDSATRGMSEAEVRGQLEQLKLNYDMVQQDLNYNMKALNGTNKAIEEQNKKLQAIFLKNEITEQELQIAKELMQNISTNLLDEFQKKVQHLTDQKNAIAQDKDIQFKSVQNIRILNDKIKKLEASKKELLEQYSKVKNDAFLKKELLDKASIFSLANVNIKGVKVKKNGREVETDKASRITRLKVNFVINNHPIIDSGNQELYIIVKNSKGILKTFQNQKSGTFLSNQQKLNYSDKINFY